MQFFRRRHDRGRPPHPDVLTPAEWRVLEHIRERRTNAETAVRLGVSVNTVRTHVSSMLAKLEVADREELARWRGEPALASRAALEASHVPVALGPLAWLRDAFTSPVLKAVATGAVVVLAGAAIVGIASVASSMDDEVVEPTPAAAPTEASEEITAPAPTPEQAIISAPVAIDGDFLVVSLPSTQSSQPPSHIELVTVEDGSIQSQDVVLDPLEFGGEAAYLNTWRNIHYPARAAGDATFVAICQSQCGGMGPAAEDARTVLVRSMDHGATWDVLDTLDGAFQVWSWSSDGDEAILSSSPTDGSTAGAWEIVHWPSMLAVTRPVLQHGAVLTDRSPMLLADDSLTWWTTEGLVDEQGELLLDFADLGALPADGFEASLSPDGQRLVLTWTAVGSAQNAPWRWTLLEQDPGGRFAVRQTLMQPESVRLAVPYSWLDADRVVIPASLPPAALGAAADARVGYVPAIVDFRTATVSPIAGFDHADVIWRGNLVIHIEPN